MSFTEKDYMKTIQMKKPTKLILHISTKDVEQDDKRSIVDKKKTNLCA